MDEVFWPEQVSVGEVLYPPSGSYGPRIQPTIELVWLIRGEMTVWIDGVPRSAAAGTVAILFPGHEERFVFSRSSETYHQWAHISVPTLPASIYARLAQLTWPLPLTLPMADLIRQALGLQTSGLSTTAAMLKALSAQMIWRYLGEGEYLQQWQGVPQRTIEEARRYIQAHLSEPLTVKQIAAAAALSESHLIRLFRAQVGKPPMVYVWEQRVEKGLALLRHSGLPIDLIAQQCGFQNRYHFSRRIKQATGLTPLQVRQRG